MRQARLIASTWPLAVTIVPSSSQTCARVRRRRSGGRSPEVRHAEPAKNRRAKTGMPRLCPSALSDADLLSTTRLAAEHEREATARLVALLAEVDRDACTSVRATGRCSRSARGHCTCPSTRRTRASRRPGRRDGFLEFWSGCPFAAGGPSSVDNLRLRCRAHNQYQAERAGLVVGQPPPTRSEAS